MSGTYRTLWSLIAQPERRRYRRIVLLSLLAGLLDLAGVAMILPFLGVMADPGLVDAIPVLARLRAALGDPDPQAFLFALGLATMAFVLSAVAARALTFVQVTVFSREMKVSFAKRRMRTILDKPYPWFLTRRRAEMRRTVLQEINEVVDGSVATSMRAIASAWQVLLLTLLLLAVEPVGAIGMGLMVGICFLAIERASRARIERMGEGHRRANQERFAAAEEALGGIKELKLSGLEDAHVARFERPSRRLGRYQVRIAVLSELPRFALESLTFGGVILLTLFLLWRDDGSLQSTLPVLGALAFAALRLMPTAQALFRDVAMMRFGTVALKELADDLRAPPPPPGRPAPPLREALTLAGVSYAYPQAERPALRDVTLRIPAGAAVALVGATGSGKTTLVDLMLGLVEPAAGEVRIDGVPLTAEMHAAWRARIAYVPQTIYLADDTVAANVAHGGLGDAVDEDRLRRACTLAQLDELLAQLPEGLETRIGDDGIRLSGGQRQRLGLARALYRDAELLVLDEATSALDPATEAAVLSAIRGLAGTRTILMVTHRLSDLGWCDRVVVLDEGRVAADGPPEAVARSDAFAALHRGEAPADGES